MAMTDIEHRSSSASAVDGVLSALLARAVDGDEQAYQELIAGVLLRLEMLARRMFSGNDRLRRWEDTDDVLQSALLRIHRSLVEVRPASMNEFFGLAVTQIRRTLIDLARHHFGPEGAAAHHQSDTDPARLHQHVRNAADPSGPPHSLDDWADFHHAIETLEADEQEVFGLIWFGGLRQQDVAEVLGVSLPTVKRRWRRARLQLYEALGGQAPES